MQTITIALIFLFAVVAYLFVAIGLLQQSHGEKIRQLEQEIWKLKFNQLRH